MSDFGIILGYGKTRKLSSAEKKKVNTLVTDIITKLTDEYDAEYSRSTLTSILSSG